MVLGGLWHGAAWGFVLWGAIHGGALVIEHVVPRAGCASPPGWLKWSVVFHIVVPGVDPVPRARPRPRGRVHLALRRLGPGDAVDVRRSSSSSFLVIGLQLLPTQADGRAARALRAAASRRAGREHGGRHRARRRDRVQPGRATVHLLPVLRTMPTMRRQRPLHPRPPDRRGALRARDALVCVFVAVLAAARSSRARRSAARARRWTPGIERTRRARRRPSRRAGSPTAAARRRRRRADRVAVARRRRSAAAGRLRLGAGRRRPVQAAGAGAGAPITPDAFDPAALGDKPAQLPQLKTLLVTGDSLAQPLDVQLARRLADDGVRDDPRRAPRHRASRRPTSSTGACCRPSRCARTKPEAVVFFLGANEGFPFQGAGGEHDRVLRPRVGGAVRDARAADDGHLPPRRRRARVLAARCRCRASAPRQKIARAVNAAIVVAAQPYRAQVRVLDMNAVFTPGGRYRASMADRRPQHDRARARRHPPQRGRRRALPPTSSWRA